MTGPRHHEIPQDDGGDENPNETCKLVLIGKIFCENSGFVIF